MINNLRNIGALGAVYVACAAVGTAQAAGPGDRAEWLTALNERSEALNREYGLGDHANRRQFGAPGPNWLVALNARSDGLNRKYGLGEYGRQGAGTASSSDWLVALNVRSDALNRKYGLGDDRPTRQAGG